MSEAKSEENIVPVSTTDTSVEEFLKTLRAAAKRRQRVMTIVGAAGIIVPGSCAFLLGLGWGAITSGIATLLLAYLRRSGRRLRKELVDMAAAQEDTRAIGPLLQMCEAELPYQSNEMLAALAVLLPRLQSASELSIEERRTLSSLLQGPSDRECALAVLQTVAQIPVPDIFTLNAVKELAQGSGIARRHPDIRQLAETVLPILEERRKTDEAHASLLRASSADAISADSLLRAADAHSQQTAPEELLRSVTPEPTTSTRSVTPCESTEAADVLQRSARSS